MANNVCLLITEEKRQVSEVYGICNYAHLVILALLCATTQQSYRRRASSSVHKTIFIGNHRIDAKLGKRVYPPYLPTFMFCFVFFKMLFYIFLRFRLTFGPYGRKSFKGHLP